MNELIDNKNKNKIQSFIEQGNMIHNNKYDYSHITNIKTKRTNIPIICPIHGLFTTTVERHLLGKDCRKCGWEKTRLTKEIFITRARNKHGDKFDYSKVEFTSIHNKVIIICPIHGEFEQQASAHFKCGCDKCARDKTKLSNEDFIDRVKNVHGDRYDYSMTKYTTNYNKVIIICKTHGMFEQRAYEHARGNGCPKCKISHGERLIKSFLVRNSIIHETEYKISGTLYRYDFYIPELNLLIEYDGQLHFMVGANRGGLNRLKYHIKLDKIKDTLAYEQGYFLLRIHYKDYRNLQEIIIKYINDIYPYRYNNKFYKNKELLLKDNDIEPNAIDSILENSKTYLVLQEIKFAVKLKHNIKKYKHKSLLK